MAVTQEEIHHLGLQLFGVRLKHHLGLRVQLQAPLEGQDGAKGPRVRLPQRSNRKGGELGCLEGNVLLWRKRDDERQARTRGKEGCRAEEQAHKEKTQAKGHPTKEKKVHASNLYAWRTQVKKKKRKEKTPATAGAALGCAAELASIPLPPRRFCARA